jgi:SAM-dependent methyltransferase
MSQARKFTKDGVRDYERRRYRGLDQRLVHAREMKLIRRMIDRLLPDEAGRPVLDLPCGYGRFTPFLRGRGFSVVGADLSVEMAGRSAENAAAAGPSPPYRSVAADAGRLPFRSGAFGLVFSIRFFHHVHSPEGRMAILREFRRVSSGYVVVSFYRANGLHVLQRRLRRIFGKSRTNIKMLEAGIFEKAAAEAGFEVEKVVPLFRGLHAYHLALLKSEAFQKSQNFRICT